MTTAADRRARYRTDDAYRLRCINHARRARGSDPIASLSDAYSRRPVETRLRDASGRFAPDQVQA
jgi:hypothetical protein